MPHTIVDLFRIAQVLKGDYENRIIAELNDHVIRVSRMTNRYFWHRHPNSDEAFLGGGGVLVLELEDRTLELPPGHFFNVPKVFGIAVTARRALHKSHHRAAGDRNRAPGRKELTHCPRAS